MRTYHNLEHVISHIRFTEVVLVFHRAPHIHAALITGEVEENESLQFVWQREHVAVGAHTYGIGQVPRACDDCVCCVQSCEKKKRIRKKTKENKQSDNKEEKKEKKEKEHSKEED